MKNDAIYSSEDYVTRELQRKRKVPQIGLFNPPTSLETLEEINACADYFVKITGCTKADALRAMLAIYEQERRRNYSALIKLVPAWINEVEDESVKVYETEGVDD